MPDVILPFAKAWAALVGSVITALVATMTDPPSWLPVALAVVTAVATFGIPNAPKGDELPPVTGGGFFTGEDSQDG